MSWNVIMTSRAKGEVESIYDYIAERSPDGAVRWLRAFQRARDELAEQAERFGSASESDTLQPELRQRFFSTKRGNRYRIVFKIVGADVFVLHVRGQGQNLIDT